MGFRQRPSWHVDAVRGAVHPIIPGSLRQVALKPLRRAIAAERRPRQGKLSQHAVAEGRRIVFAASRKGDDALRESFSFCLVVAGKAELVADLIKGD